jgi:hypothetical protein
MLQYTGEDADIQQAEKVYINILHDRPDDVTANYRLGALYRKLGSLDKSKELLDRALRAVASGVDERINKSHFLYDSLRREIGLTEWRISEDEKRSSDARLKALMVALKAAYDVLLHQAVPDEHPVGADTRFQDLVHLSAINDFLYYRWYLGELSGSKDSFPILAEDEQKYGQELYDFYRSRKKEQQAYNYIDTLLRCYIDDQVKARQLALDLVFVLEKSVLEQSPDQTLPEFESIRWYGALVTQLNKDERDALTYAYEFLRKRA